MNSKDLTRFEAMILNMAGDSRNSLSRISLRITDGGLYLAGSVDSEDLASRIRDFLNREGITFIDALKCFSSDIPDPLKFAMVVTSTCDIRKDGRFRSERIHQLIFGEWVSVLELGNTYTTVKDLKTGYVGCVATKSLDFCSKDGMSEILSLSKAIVGNRFSKIERIVSQTDNDMWLPMGSRLYLDFVSGEHSTLKTPSYSYKVRNSDIIHGFMNLKDHFDHIISSYEGVPYIWGGSSTYGTDCSGFAGRLYDLFGIFLPRDADQQEKFSKEVKPEDLSKADLVFFPGHVAVYIGNGMIAHSNTSYSGVSINSLLTPTDAYEDYLLKSVTKYGRIF